MKKIAASIMAACMLLTLMVGCGGPKDPSSAPAPNSDSTPAPASTPDAVELPENTEDPADETYGGNDSEADTGSAPDSELEDEAATGGDWFARQGLKITPQGDVNVTCGVLSKDGTTDVGTFDTTANVVIERREGGAPEGFKRLWMTAEIDLGDYGDANPTETWAVWRTAFDRYTGTSFEFAGELPDNPFGDMFLSRHAQILDLDGKEVLIYIQFSGYPTVNNTFVSEIEFICPEDYDGAVFQLGPNSKAMNDEYNQVYAGGPTTNDKLPQFGGSYLYFTENDK